MGQSFDEIPLQHIPWIKKQEMFWVATAPLNKDGHVNMSPKGIRDCFFILNQKKVWYEDLSGSGSETIAHLRENGRITIMFHAFEGPARIIRLYGTGTVHEFGTPEYDALISPETRKPGSRSAIVIDVHRVSTSCGFAVPYYTFKSHRTTLLAWADGKEKLDRAECAASANPETTVAAKGLRAYWMEHLESIDGLPSLLAAHKSRFPPHSTMDWKSSDFIGSDQNTGTSLVENVVDTREGNEATRMRWFEDVKLAGAFSIGVLAGTAYMRWSNVR